MAQAAKAKVRAAFTMEDRRTAVDAKHAAFVDKHGTFSTPVLRPSPRTHAQIQQDARQLGEAQITAFMQQAPSRRKRGFEEMNQVTVAVESGAISAGFVPGDHAQRAQRFGRDPSGKSFRNIRKKQDEFTQSQRSSHHVSGMNAGLAKAKVQGGFSPVQLAQAEALRDHTARMFSALRMPTEDVSAPIQQAGQRMGMFHPSSLPSWPGGAGAHSTFDRERAQHANEVGRVAMAIDPVASVIATGASAAQFTFAHGAFPHTASNVHSQLSPVAAQQQALHREVGKDQVRAMLPLLHIPMPVGTQPLSAPVVKSSAPLSPRRV